MYPVGPGNPESLTTTVDSIRWALTQHKPIFGICMGHSTMALAAGGQTYKLPYGNRGQNQPCMNIETGRCFITAQV